MSTPVPGILDRCFGAQGKVPVSAVYASGLWLHVQHHPQGRVDAAQLVEAATTHTVAVRAGIDRRGLFSQHVRETAVDLDTGP